MKFNFKQIIIIVIIGMIVLATIATYAYKTFLTNEEEYELEIENEIVQSEERDIEENTEDEILIHVTGCVKKQGIVILKENSRIIDAINAAEGETENADLNKVNLAYVLQDGDKLYIPSKNEDNNEGYISSDSGNNIIVDEVSKTKPGGSDIVNINTDGKEKLQTLSGIGESTANKIIKYREENGKFKTIDDIKNVPGIGNAKFEKFKDNITV